MLHAFCFAHLPTKLLLPSGTYFVCMGGKSPPSAHGHVLNVEEIFPELAVWHNFLGGSVGTIAVCRLLKSQPNAYLPSDKIVLMQYRKFISRIPLGKLSNNYPGMYLVAEDEAHSINLNDVFEKYTTDFLFSHPIMMSSYIQHYSNSHSLVDYLRYFAIAVEMGVLSPDECLESFNAQTLIPGGIEFGVFPVPVFLELVGKIDAVCSEFLKTHRPQFLDTYNRRALAFCNERLGSFMLIKHLRSAYPSGVPDEFTGYMHTVMNGNSYIGGIV